MDLDLASKSAHVPSEFERAFGGMLFSLLAWEQLTAFWERVDPAAGWYVYAVGERVPEKPSSAEQVSRFIREIDDLLRREHDEDYCGIVYADDLKNPRLIKIYDPNHLGSSCGSAKQTILPGWVLSRMPPVELRHEAVVTAGRRRWWQSLFALKS
jgi:hypothetical protein